MNNKEYVPTMEEKIDEFFDVMDILRSAYYENIRLKQEVAKLKKESKERFEQIMDMSRKSQQGLDNWIKLLLEGKIKITPDEKE
jgi:SepF-like predicted cell division protein (DUF552 family)